MEILDKLGAVAAEEAPFDSDSRIYQRLLRDGASLAVELAEHLLPHLLNPMTSLVVADSAEGFNPTHDLVRIVVNAAVMEANRTRANPLRSLAFPLVGPPVPQDRVEFSPAWVRLSEQGLKEKVEAARGYEQLAKEVENILRKYGEDPFALEYFHTIVTPGDCGYFEQPHYELVGKERFLSGLYEEVITFADHLLPVAEGLHRWALSRP